MLAKHRVPPAGPGLLRCGFIRPSKLMRMGVQVHSTASQASNKKTAVVVGGGWAGFGAAYALAKAGAAVTLIDAAEQPGGLSSAWKTDWGRLVEPGIKGFWYQYGNINALVDELGIPSPFTEWTSSSFWTPEGLQVVSPILQHQIRLPAPLGNLVHTSPYFTNLPITDRLTALPLVKALMEYDSSEEMYAQYDKMSAYELFRSAGVSKRLYTEFLEPMLLVTLFCPGEQLSAAAALDALYYFVLAHQPDFDVRWCKGPVAERILGPFAKRLESMGVTILGGRMMQDVAAGANGLPTQVHVRLKGGATETLRADTIVFAVGVSAMQRIVNSSPMLGAAQDFSQISNLSCIDVMAVRLWLDKRVPISTPSNVLARFDDSVGSTLFDLTELQDEYKREKGSVLEMDFYHAETLLPLSDDEITSRIMDTYLPVVNPAFSECKVLDRSILRFSKAVTAFSPNSGAFMPSTTTSLPNVFMAGDWVKQGPGTHGAKGLSQEKAYVTGIQAGNAAASYCGLNPVMAVVPVEPDEPQVQLGKQLAKAHYQFHGVKSWKV